jgi:hypothetical protein
MRRIVGEGDKRIRRGTTGHGAESENGDQALSERVAHKQSDLHLSFLPWLLRRDHRVTFSPIDQHRIKSSSTEQVCRRSKAIGSGTGGRGWPVK